MSSLCLCSLPRSCPPTGCSLVVEPSWGGGVWPGHTFITPSLAWGGVSRQCGRVTHPPLWGNPGVAAGGVPRGALWIVALLPHRGHVPDGGKREGSWVGAGWPSGGEGRSWSDRGAGGLPGRPTCSSSSSNRLQRRLELLSDGQGCSVGRRKGGRACRAGKRERHPEEENERGEGGKERGVEREQRPGGEGDQRAGEQAEEATPASAPDRTPLPQTKQAASAREGVTPASAPDSKVPPPPSLAAGAAAEAAEALTGAARSLGSAEGAATPASIPDPSPPPPPTLAAAAEAVVGATRSMDSAVQSRITEMGEGVAEVVPGVGKGVASVLSSSPQSDMLFEGEFEEFQASGAVPGEQWRGRDSLDRIRVIQDGSAVLSLFQDLYLVLLKWPPPLFAAALFASPVLCSALFAPLYLLDLAGLSMDDAAADKFQELRMLLHMGQGETDSMSLADVEGGTLNPLVWLQVFMFSLSLHTGLSQLLYPESLFAIALANVNALAAQLLLVFLTGAVFARLTQPKDPIRCSNVALISPRLLLGRNAPTCTLASSAAAEGDGGRRGEDDVEALSMERKGNSAFKPTPAASAHEALSMRTLRLLLLRYLVLGPLPSELVDVKVELTLKEDTTIYNGSFFRRSTPLKLVKSEESYQRYGMVVRHVINEQSPLVGRTQEDLERCNAQLNLCVLGTERSSMQPVFHIQRYFFSDGDIIWNAEFEDTAQHHADGSLTIDYRKLNDWRPADLLSRVEK